MATQVQWRGGSTAEHATFTGAAREVTVDTQKKTLVVHDGSTAGGEPLLREDQANLPSSVTNGLYTPGTNQVALSTAGTGRLFVDASGNVKLDTGGLRLRGDGNSISADQEAATYLRFSVNSVNALDIQRISSSGAQLRVAQFSTGASAAGYPAFTNSADPNTGVFFPDSSDTFGIATGGTERLRITSDGKLGVGTSNPAYPLVVSASGASGIEFGPAFSGTANLIQHYDRTGGAYVDAVNDAAQHRFNTSGTERLRITSDGKVGVGTSSPVIPLDVNTGAAGAPVVGFGQSGNDPFIHLERFTGATNYDAVRISSAFGSAQGGVLTISNGTGATKGQQTFTERLRITADGNVGVGTANPENYSGGHTTLEVRGTSGTGGGIFQTRTFDASVSGYFYADSSTNTARIGTVTNHPFLIITGTQERLRIDSSGRLLVGTSSARSYTTLGYARFQVEGTSWADSSIGLTNNEAAADGSYLVFNKTRGASVGSSTIVNSGDKLGSIWFQGADGTNSVRGAVIEAVVDGTPGTGDMPGRLVFSTTADGASTPTERMRINQSGAIGSFAASSDANIYLSNAASAGTTTPFLRGRYAATGVYGGIDSVYIWSNGDIKNTNNSYGAISDIKLKENIVDANSQWDDIKALQVRNYNFKEGQTHTQLGLIAQEVELVSPGLVSESPDRDEDGNDLGTVTKSVNYSVLYMKAVKALQEAMERIETLEAKVAALESN